MNNTDTEKEKKSTELTNDQKLDMLVKLIIEAEKNNNDNNKPKSK